jgi:hypothetical protein
MMSQDITITRTKARVLKGRWVALQNETPVKNINHSFQFNSTVYIQPDGVVTVIHHDLHLGEILVEYTAPSRLALIGTVCPTGALFFLSETEFDDPERFEVIQEGEGDPFFLTNALRKT